MGLALNANLVCAINVLNKCVKWILSQLSLNGHSGVEMMECPALVSGGGQCWLARADCR